MSDAREAFLEHARTVQQYAALRLSEADTRSYLIDPVLRILGYDGVEHLRREVPVPATKEFVDYELLVDGEPQATRMAPDSNGTQRLGPSSWA